MKIAFDLHGVLEKYPKEFKAIINVLHSLGADVGVISGPPRNQIVTELSDLGFFPVTDYFQFVYSIVDFLQRYPIGVDEYGGEIYVKMWQDDKEDWWCNDLDWWSSKGRMCIAYDIDVLIDDRMEYYTNFSLACETKFVHMKNCEFDQFILKFLDMIKGIC